MNAAQCAGFPPRSVGIPPSMRAEHVAMRTAAALVAAAGVWAGASDALAQAPRWDADGVAFHRAPGVDWPARVDSGE